MLCRPRAIELADALKPETLVPIRIEFDVEHHKVRDTFVWNLNGGPLFFLGADQVLIWCRSCCYTRDIRAVCR